MKRIRVKPDKPASPAVPVEQLTPQKDPSLVHCARTITLRVGASCYEMTLRSEVREITKGPAKVIEMPRRPGRKR